MLIKGTHAYRSALCMIANNIVNAALNGASVSDLLKGFHGEELLDLKAYCRYLISGNSESRLMNL